MINALPEGPEPSPPTGVVVCLCVAAGLAALLAAAWAVLGLVLAIEDNSLDGVALLQSVTFLAGGFAAAALLLAGAYVVRHQHEAAVARRRQETAPPPVPPARPAGIGPDLATGIIEQIERLNENVLLSEADREAKRRQRASQRSAGLEAAVEQAIAARDFPQADREIVHLAKATGDEARCEALRRQVDEARRATRAADIAAATRRLEELMSVGSFEAAQAAVGALLAQYPDEPGAQALLDRVRREGRAFEAEERKRLYRDVRRLAKAGEWAAACEAGERLLWRYPDSTEAGKVAVRLATLQENARIEEARALRDDIRDMIRRRRYDEALRLADDILDRFPDTKAAGELREQMGRLRRLAAKKAADTA